MRSAEIFRVVAGLFVFTAVRAMAIEEAAYKVVQEDDGFEVRDYPAQLVAETTVTGNQEEAGDKAFNRLFRYISGHNKSKTPIDMTAPVSQENASGSSEKIAMTAPVGQVAAPTAGSGTNQDWVVSFMMPAAYSLETIPEPADSAVTIREIPARRMAAIRYSGTWSEKRYRKHLLKLEQWMSLNQLVAIGEPVWARYNPPFTPWFLRRNEILLPLAPDASAVQNVKGF